MSIKKYLFSILAVIISMYSVTLIVVAAEGKETEAVLRLARVGYENVAGVLSGGMEAWQNANKTIDTVNSISAADFVTNIKNLDTILDVRKPGEIESGMIENAQHICLSDLQNHFSSFDKNANYAVHCAGGYRSMMAVSLMKRHGFKHLTNVLGGMGKIKETGIKLIQPVNI